LKLGIVVSNRSIRRYRWRKPRPEGSQAWRTFLKNHLNGIWAADLFVVQTVGYQILYVIVLISHDRRKLVHFNVTSHPTAAWVWQQLIEATPWARQPSHLTTTGTLSTAVTSTPGLEPWASPESRPRVGRRTRTRSPNGS
jgi:putative transposase